MSYNCTAEPGIACSSLVGMASTGHPLEIITDYCTLPDECRDLESHEYDTYTNVDSRESLSAF